MRREGVDSYPVYDNGVIVGKISYDELMDFLAYKEGMGAMQAHKQHFDLNSALTAIRDMRVDEYKVAKKKDMTHKLIAGFSSVAAVAAILLGLSWFFLKPAPASTSTNEVFTDRITLTLNNGKNISLDQEKAGVVFANNQLKYNDGSKVEAAYEGKQLVTLNTPKGGLYQVVLPDGTKAWLNAASHLKFPSTFAGAMKRRVELTGEAYFEVAKDKKHPFIVASKGQEIEVLGTHFNVTAYGNDGNIKTTLLEGSVRVTPFQKADKRVEGTDPATIDPLWAIETRPAYVQAGDAVVLKPNQQAVLTGKNIAVKAVEAEDAIAWRQGEYIFRNMPLESVMQVIARWYDVDVIYQNKTVGDALLGGSVLKADSVSEVLKTLELTANVHFKVEGRRITVTQ
ncbi:transmembrane sensor [Pedobacter africanus]|uniref:Ferric-dicitrate binding protein FerR (Iron transport regulator) n=2 Tax=Pedobacter africanus TaxID=151894 RepID=A0ACC6KQI5_9SPHI|nr:ferric-dicitrate binding protein FerR (iron transport regulator) [Pedobacter africanus]